MNSNKKIARIVGLLFITATVAYSIGVILLDPILSSSDYLTIASENEKQMIMGSFLVLIDAVAVAGIGIMIYPILKKQNEALALGYAGSRIAEGVLFVANVIAILILLALSQEFVKAEAPDTSYYQTFGTILLEAGDLAFLFGFAVAFTISALILNYLLYKSKLVPRWLSGWGFVGALLLWVYYLLEPFSINLLYILFVPIALQEMVFAVWLIVKGFNPSVIDPASASTDTNEI
ncbi:DUF4386 domain-containing protein [Methanococcoides methylutens]|uniref:DUF4386 domain-containing protein n=1 Tax=Methanococcoides methylutens MM1 TaxID=1434104 RepID=A0A0E3SSA4_METMT|nr:DUF4386 domain-containing protein [Methanococcoides methylutens]AKB85237.1 hypothetical protein MCMEM_1184 [Methanococcoides methylutens MM1]